MCDFNVLTPTDAIRSRCIKTLQQKRHQCESLGVRSAEKDSILGADGGSLGWHNHLVFPWVESLNHITEPVAIFRASTCQRRG